MELEKTSRNTCCDLIGCYKTTGNRITQGSRSIFICDDCLVMLAKAKAGFAKLSGGMRRGGKKPVSGPAGGAVPAGIIVEMHAGDPDGSVRRQPAR